MKKKGLWILLIAVVLLISAVTAMADDSNTLPTAINGVIDLNNKTYTLSSQYTHSSGDVTIKNGTIVTDGVTDAIVINAGTLTFGENLTVKSTRGAIIDAEGGKFVLAGAKLEGGNTYTTVYIGSNAEMNMTEGEITGPDKGALSVYGRATVTGGTISASNGSTIKAGSGGTVNLNGGKISNGNSSLCAVFAVSGGKVVVDGAEIDGAGGALIAAGGTVEVKSGTIKDSSLALVAHSGGTATISGGTFTGSRYAVSDNADGRQCYGPSSGSFYTSGTVTITGGTFSMDPSAYLASNYEIAKTVDDMYKVIASGTATAKIGEIKYVTLADAVTAANVNDAITMLTDETLTASVTIDKSKSITLDLNGKKISTATGFNGLAAITNYGTLTVGGNGSITSSKYGIDNAGGTLTLNACTITSTTSGYYAVFNSWKELNGTYHGGTTIVNNSATLKQTNDESKGGIYAEAGNVYIHGGTVGRINAGKYTSSGTNTTLTGTVSIDGGAMKGYLYSKDGGTIIVSGGVFSKKISGWTGNNTTFNATIATNYSIVSLDNATYPYGVVTTPTVSVSGATTKTYDGAGVTLTATATPSVEKMTANGTEYTIKYNYQWSKSGSDNTYTNIEDATSSTYTTDANVADSGTYRFTVTSATGDAALNVYADATVTINPAAVTVTAKDQSIYVNGTIPDLSAPALDTHYTVTGLLNGDTLTTTPTLAYQQGGSSATPDTATAGTYDIVASGASAGDNYTITYTNGTLTISNKNKQTITAKNVTATYGDTDKSVSASVTDPTEGGGAISYAVKDGSGDYINVEATTGALTINKAGIATVVVTAAETDTYEQATKEVTVTIAKADITPTVSISDWTYGTAANDPNVTGNTGDGTVTYSYKVKDAEESTYSETVPTTVGDYTVKASIAATDNYMSGEATADFTIVKANAIVTAPTAKTLTYNGQEQELVTAGEATGGTIQYALGENAETVPTTGWNTSIPPAIDAGT